MIESGLVFGERHRFANDSHLRFIGNPSERFHLFGSERVVGELHDEFDVHVRTTRANDLGNPMRSFFASRAAEDGNARRALS